MLTCVTHPTFRANKYNTQCKGFLYSTTNHPVLRNVSVFHTIKGKGKSEVLVHQYISAFMKKVLMRKKEAFLSYVSINDWLHQPKNTLSNETNEVGETEVVCETFSKAL